MITITGKTKLAGLLGQPVSHSLSPIMHNAAYEEMGLDWCYVAIPCDAETLDQTAKTLRHINCKGLNITIPHKQEILKSCYKLSTVANKIKAVNTLIPENNNKWIGANTDVEGFLKPLKNHDLTNKNVVVIGCGGSARAVVMGLHSLNLKQITVIGRNEISLNNFIDDMKNIANDKDTIIKGINNGKSNIASYIEDASVIINTTPIGMNSTTDFKENIPLGSDIWNNLSNKSILYDLI